MVMPRNLSTWPWPDQSVVNLEPLEIYTDAFCKCCDNSIELVNDPWTFCLKNAKRTTSDEK